jgi:hypothetical protein
MSTLDLKFQTYLFTVPRCWPPLPRRHAVTALPRIRRAFNALPRLPYDVPRLPVALDFTCRVFLVSPRLPAPRRLPLPRGLFKLTPCSTSAPLHPRFHSGAIPPSTPTPTLAPLFSNATAATRLQHHRRWCYATSLGPPCWLDGLLRHHRAGVWHLRGLHHGRRAACVPRHLSQHWWSCAHLRRRGLEANFPDVESAKEAQFLAPPPWSSHARIGASTSVQSSEFPSLRLMSGWWRNDAYKIHTWSLHFTTWYLYSCFLMIIGNNSHVP